MVLDTGGSLGVQAVTFHPDGKHVLGGSNGIRRWQLKDGQEVGTQMGKNLYAISVSRDCKWIVCATEEGGADVWDAEMQEKVVDVEGGKTVMTVDVSPDSTMFATGTGLGDDTANVWSLTTGKRLVGPLKHTNFVTAVRFSPNSMRIATACWEGSIRVFDSRNGDELITIDTVTPSIWPCTPLAWSNDSQQIFAASKDNKIKLFDASTGSQLAESQTLTGGNVDSIALAASGKFIATFAGSTILFLNTSTLSHIDPVIEDSETIWAIAISPDTGYLATGVIDGKITIRDLGRILPDSFGPFHVSIYPFATLPCKTSLVPSPTLTLYIRHLIARRDNQTTSIQPRAAVTANHLTPPRYEFTILSSKAPRSLVVHQEEPRTSSPLESKTHSDNGNDDLLEVSVRFFFPLGNEFSRSSRSWRHPARLPPHSITMRLIFIALPSPRCADTAVAIITRIVCPS